MMNETFFDLLGRPVAAEELKRHMELALVLESLYRDMAASLAAHGVTGRRREELLSRCRSQALTILEQTDVLLRDALGVIQEHVGTTGLRDPHAAEEAKQPPPTPLAPELLEWARQKFSEEEIAAALREFQATAGLELKDFVHELEEIVANDG